MYKPSNYGFVRNDTSIDCSQIGDYSLVVKDENFFNRNQYRLTYRIEKRPVLTTQANSISVINLIPIQLPKTYDPLLETFIFISTDVTPNVQCPSIVQTGF